MTIRFDLADRTALVTGAASGIGLATATLMARAGARVALNYLRGDARGPDAVAELQRAGLDVVGAPGDVSHAETAATIVAIAAEARGLDYLVNNAGVAAAPEPIPASDLDALGEARWMKVLSTNLLGPFHCTRAASRALREARGAIVNVASIAGFDQVGSSIAYGASKAALINMTKNLARGLAPEVRVNAVAPGFVSTSWTERWPKAKLDTAREAALLKRACSPEDVAEVIVYLCAGAAMTTGQTWLVDGGLSLA